MCQPFAQLDILGLGSQCQKIPLDRAFCVFFIEELLIFGVVVVALHAY